MNASRRIAFLLALGTVGCFSFQLMRELFIEPFQIFFHGETTSAGVASDSSQNLKAVAEYLQNDKRAFIKKPAPPPVSTEIVHAKLPFGPEWIATLESEEIKQRLAQVDSEDPRRLVEDLNDVILRTDISHVDEKQKLIELSNYFERVYQLGISQELFYQEADLYFTAEDANDAGYGRRALEFALALEPNRERQEDERQRFYASHVQNPVQDSDMQQMGVAVDDSNRIPAQTSPEE